MKALQIDRALDGNLKQVKDSDGTMTGLELSTDTLRVKNLEVVNDFTYPAEYGFARLDDDGTQDANENNFGVGSIVYGDMTGIRPLSSPNIRWDGTNSVFNVNKTGIYEVVCDAAISINATRTVSLEVYINTAADTLGTEVHATSIEIDSGDDPLPQSIRWMGRVENGEHIAVTLQSEASRTPMFMTGSTLRILRIA